MDAPQLPGAGISPFMVSHLPDFLDRFGISFSVDGPQLEYFVYEKKSGLDISCSLTFSLDAATGRITVMTFYPGICLLQGCRYLSAVCFFLILQHFARFHHITADCGILLKTRRGVFDAFYALLGDFDFHVLLGGEEDSVDIRGRFLPLAMDISMIDRRLPADDAAGPGWS